MTITNFCSSVASGLFDLVPGVAPLYRGDQLVKTVRQVRENANKHLHAPSGDAVFNNINSVSNKKEAEQTTKTAFNHFLFSNLASLTTAWGLTALKVITASHALIGVGILAVNALITLYRSMPPKELRSAEKPNDLPGDNREPEQVNG